MYRLHFRNKKNIKNAGYCFTAALPAGQTAMHIPWHADREGPQNHK